MGRHGTGTTRTGDSDGIDWVGRLGLEDAGPSGSRPGPPLMIRPSSPDGAADHPQIARPARSTMGRRRTCAPRPRPPGCIACREYRDALPTFGTPRHRMHHHRICSQTKPSWSESIRVDPAGRHSPAGCAHGTLGRLGSIRSWDCRFTRTRPFRRHRCLLEDDGSEPLLGPHS
jgi:hypothetical protein